MLRIRLRPWWVLSMVIAASLMFFVASALGSLPDTNGCDANIQNPHYSNTHGGIDVTGVWTCTKVPTTIEMGYFDLWLCPVDYGEKNLAAEDWIINHCTFKGSNDGNFNVTIAGSAGAQDRTVPSKYVAAAHGTGWWIACTIWHSVGPGGTSEDHGPMFSNWIYISG
jgi:hypothetical protein